MSQYFIETDIFFKIQISLALKMYFNQFKAHTHTHTHRYTTGCYTICSQQESQKRKKESSVYGK